MKKSFVNLIALLIGLMLLVFWLLYIQQTATNYPFLDDTRFFAINERILNLSHWKDELNVLLEPHSEHRFFVGRSVFLAQYLATGSIDMQQLILFFNLFWIAVVGVLYFIFTKLKQPFYYFLPICLFMFQIKMGTCILWFSALVNYPTSIFFSLCSMYLLQKRGLMPKFLSFVNQILALLCCGAGFFLFLSNLVVLLAQRRYKYFAVLFLLNTLTLVAYFNKLDLTIEGGSLEIGRVIWGASSFLVSTFFIPISKFIPPKITIIGVCFVGFPLVGYSVYFFVNSIIGDLKTKISSSNATIENKALSFFLCNALLYVGLLAFAMSIRRDSEDWVGMIQTRYELYSCLFLALIYLTLFYENKIRRKTLFWSFTSLGALLILVYSPISYFMESNKSKIIQCNAFNDRFFYKEKRVWSQLRQTENYFYSPFENKLLMPEHLYPTDTNIVIRLVKDNQGVKETRFNFNLTNVNFEENKRRDGLFLLFKGDGLSYLLNVKTKIISAKEIRKALAAKQLDLTIPKVATLVDTNFVAQPRVYKILVYKIENDKDELLNTNYYYDTKNTIIHSKEGVVQSMSE